jgi:hypothetical protein
MWTKGTTVHRRPKDVQWLYQNDELLDSAHQVKPPLRIFLASTMELEVEELVVLVCKRMQASNMYLCDGILTKGLSVSWSMSQTSLPRREVLTSLALQILGHPKLWVKAILSQLTKLTPTLLKFFQIKCQWGHKYSRGAKQPSWSRWG